MIDPQFQFALLQPFFIPKSGGRYRVICVPTVHDRLVQRVVLKYLNEKDKLKVNNEISFGFRSNVSVHAAAKRAKNLRNTNGWVLKCDIQSFFDNIRRTELKEKLRRSLNKSSVLPIIERAIDCEIKEENRSIGNRIRAQGIVAGLGLRQGMPLSPVLANYVLRGFDRELAKRGWSAVRYADDFIVMMNSKSECEDAFEIVREELRKLGHTLDPLNTGKSQIVAPPDDLDFLGYAVRRAPSGTYQLMAPQKAFDEIKHILLPYDNFPAVVKESEKFSQTINSINAKVTGFVNAYKGAKNFENLKSHAGNCRRSTLTSLLSSIFGVNVVSGLGREPINGIPSGIGV